MDNERSYHLPMQICPRCGYTTCQGIDCSDCRYRKFDEFKKYDHCFIIGKSHDKYCNCSINQLEKFYRLREADLERLAHQIRTIIKFKTGEIHG